MKKYFSLVMSCLLLFGLVSAQTPLDPMHLPKLTEYVTDFSKVMTDQQAQDLNTLAHDYETKTSNQLVTVLFPTRNGNELLDIGMHIFKDNLIGQKDKNNGLLLIISTDEKKIRIIVGYGLEGIYPDITASQIIEQDIRPLVNSGDYYGAIKAFYARSADVIGGEYQSTSPDTSSSSSTSSPSSGADNFKALFFLFVV